MKAKHPFRIVPFLLLGAVLIGVSASNAIADYSVVAPGETVTLTGQLWNAYAEQVPSECEVGWDLSQRKLFVSAVLLAGYNGDTHRAIGWVADAFYLQLSPGDPSSLDRPVGATISGTVDWRAYLQYGVGCVGNSQSRFEIYAVLWDELTSEQVAYTKLVDQSERAPSYLPDLNGAFRIHTASAPFTFSVKLKRGHTYQVRVRGVATTDAGGAGYAMEAVLAPIELGLFDGYIHVGNIEVEVDRDLIGEIEALQQALDALRSEYDRHSHGYRTGVGEGHNNVEATTSTPDVAEAVTAEADPAPLATGKPDAAPGDSVTALPREAPTTESEVRDPERPLSRR